MYVAPAMGTGQSSSVILDQNSQMAVTAKRLNKTWNRPPLILPLVPSQIWTLMTNSKTWAMAKSKTAAMR